MHKPLAAAVLFALGLGTTTSVLAGNGTPVNDNSANVLTLAVYGDAPYGTTPTDTSEFEATPAFIDSINSDPHVDLIVCRRHPFGQAVLHGSLRPRGVRTVDGVQGPD